MGSTLTSRVIQVKFNSSLFVKKLAILLIVMVVAGCSSAERTPEQIAAAKSARKHCKDEAPTGSLMRRSRCRSSAELKREREAAQEAMRNRSTVSGGGPESQ